MNSNIAKQVIGVIKAERQRRVEQLKDEDPEVADDHWSFTDEPFINDMCLLVLAALNHQVERELVFLAARANVGPTITSEQYQTNVEKWRNTRTMLRAKLATALALKSFPEWDKSIETLRLLANCFKHDPQQEPTEELLKHLKLPDMNQLKKHNPLLKRYLPLAESGLLRGGVAVSIGLPREADYLAIAEKFAELVDQFSKDVRQKTTLAEITGNRMIFFAG